MEPNDLLRALRRPNYRVSEIAALLDLNAASVYRMLERGDLRSARVCGSLRVNRSALAEYITAKRLEVDPTVLDGGSR
ncbi:helix-turn-helix domain-containing protein [Bosea sp. OAE506]|uniref:helix-turn-helix domain-containing protein n=1 Tax=Bosea sp. OAE506 TaxID=2663870 RepID=UPI00178B206C